jgi:dihydrolipoamide dehydrogenase
VPSIYAIGDVTGKMMLAHAASKQGLIAAEHMAGHNAVMNYRVVPAAVFTHPEVSSVGLSEAQAKEQGVKVKTAKFPFQALGKALVLGEPAGFVKIVADETTGEVLGVHMIGPHVSDLIAEAALAMRLEATVRDIAYTIHTHPTLPEAMGECAEGWLGHAIHG